MIFGVHLFRAEIDRVGYSFRKQIGNGAIFENILMINHMIQIENFWEGREEKERR